MRAFAEDHHHNEHLAAQSITTCSGGMAGGYPCSNIDLMAFLPLAQIGGGNGNDIWGWTDPLGGKEYAIMGLTNGTAFVDISDPVNPIYLGHLPVHTGVGSSSWRDIKTFSNHAFIGSEANNSGMQVMDLTQLRSIVSPPVTMVETAFYSGFSRSHNIVINEDSGYAYGVGMSGNCAGGLHFVDIMNPTSPTAAGCFVDDGYTHDAQCVNYNGPDSTHVSKEICFAYNEDTLTIVDVSNKSAPVQLSRTIYANQGYSHQGWITEDHAHLLMDDELDERNFSSITNTRTLVWNIEDLDNPFHQGDYEGVSTTIDHNQYIVGNYSYQANYQSGLRILDITDIADVTMTTANDHIHEVGFFDIYTSGNATNFNGAWSVYPFFASGNVIVSGMEQGLYILRPNLGTSGSPPVTDLLDPASGSEVSGTAQIRINATDTEDADGTLNVEWNVDGGNWKPISSYTSPDYLASWDSSSVLDGSHVITARAVDSDLQEHSDSHTVTVANGMQKFTADVIDVYIDIGKGNRNRGFGTILVSDEEGEPLPNTLVETSFGGDWTGSFTRTSDTDGLIMVQTQKVKNLSFVELCVDDASLAGWEYDSAGSMRCGDSDTASAFGVVAGKVTNASGGAGISNADVTTDTSQSGTTDAFGDYFIADVPAGNRTISVTASGYDSQNTSKIVSDGATTTVNFALTQTPTGGSGSIKGTVYSGEGGKLSGVNLSITGGTSSMTNKGGKYTIQNVPGGTQIVTAEIPGYLTQMQNVFVSAGGSVTANFTLAPVPD